MKDKLYLGLHSQRLLDLTVWKCEDPKATEADLFKLIRKKTKRIQIESAIARNVELENKVQELRTQVATLSSPTNKPESKKDNQTQQWNSAKKSNKQKKPSNHKSRSAQWKRRSPFRDRYLKNLAANLELRQITEAFPYGLQITSATEHKINILGFVEVDITFPGLYQPIPVLVTVLKSSILGDQMPALIGYNGLEEWKLALERTHSSIPSINTVIDTWKCEA